MLRIIIRMALDAVFLKERNNILSIVQWLGLRFIIAINYNEQEKNQSSHKLAVISYSNKKSDSLLVKLWPL